MLHLRFSTSAKVAQLFAVINGILNVKQSFVVRLQHVSSRAMRVLIFLVSPLEFEKSRNQMILRKTLI
ncbi:hypothetical protein N184_34490 [Sinorhizobium sp. GL28]|nr:hypothetical protein N184_34490 [Sinorhizobium sp. GL28]